MGVGGGGGERGMRDVNPSIKKTKNKSQNLGLGAAEVVESWVKALPGWVYDIQAWSSFLFIMFTSESNFVIFILGLENIDDSSAT